jgi:hypothetical protein
MARSSIRIVSVLLALALSGAAIAMAAAPRGGEAAEKRPAEPRRGEPVRRGTAKPAAGKGLEAARRHVRSMRVYSTADGRYVSEGPRVRSGATRAQSAAPSLPNVGTWQKLGPGNLGGRIRALVVDPTTPSTMYAGGVGGVWKSTDGGATWAAPSDDLASQFVGTIVMDPGDPQTLLAGTGEMLYYDFVYGNGIYKSTDGGAHWTQLPGTAGQDFTNVNKIVYSAHPNVLYAATLSGVWRSMDAGANWSAILQPSSGFNESECDDLAIRRDAGHEETLFASCGRYSATIYRTADAEAPTPTWSSFTQAGMSRVSLAIAPSNQDVAYALAAAYPFGALQALYRWNEAGQVWAARATSASAAPARYLLSNAAYENLCFGFTGNYDYGLTYNTVAVDPVDENVVWAGGYDLYRSDDGGLTFGQAANWKATGPALLPSGQLTLAFPPGYDGTTNKKMFVAGVGGVFTTTDARAATSADVCDFDESAVAFTNASQGLDATPFLTGTLYPTDDAYIGGTFDRGTVRGTDGAPNAWTTLLAGYGGSALVDPVNNDVILANQAGVPPLKCTLGAACTPDDFTNAGSGISDFGGIIPIPLVADPKNPQRIWTGGSYVWRSDDAAGSWTQASATLKGRVTALAVSPADPNLVLAGTYSGEIQRTTAGLSATSSTAWTFVKYYGATVTSIVFDPVDPTVVYATYRQTGHVLKSTDSGASFSPLDGTSPNTVPDVPVHTLAVDPGDTQRLYVGTDLGVFVSTDGGLNWAQENTGFPLASVRRLVVNGANLYAFTHGRGVWRVPLTSASQTVTVEIAVPGATVEEDVVTGIAYVPVVVKTSDHAATTGAVTVDFATANGTATAGSDYTATSGTLTILSGTAHNASVSIPVGILDDTVAEPIYEAFSVGLSNPGGGVLLGRRDYTVTIHDNDSAILSVNDVAVTEGDSGTKAAVFTVTLAPARSQVVKVNYTTQDGTATASGPHPDYQARTGILTFPAGVVSRTVSVPVVGDMLQENTETFSLVLSAPVNALIADAVGQATISDNDFGGGMHFSMGQYAVREAAGTVTLTVARFPGQTAAGATVHYQTVDGSALAGSDYTAIPDSVLTFGPGVLTKTITVAIKSDAIDDHNESFFVRLFNPGGGAYIALPDAAMVTITDDDSAGKVYFSMDKYSETEGKSATITVRRTGVAGPAVVHYATSDGTATAAGGDYTSTSGDLTFAPGELAKTFTVALASGDGPEGNETVNLALSAPGGGLVLSAPSTAVLTIVDADPTFAFTASSVNVGESAGSIALTVVRTGPLTTTAKVDYATADGTATSLGPGRDFVAAAGTLTFAPHAMTQSITIKLPTDTVVEGNEDFTVTLANPAGGPALGALSTETVNIVDDDAGGTVQFASAVYPVVEPAGSLPARISVMVTRTGGKASSVTVPVTVGGGSATAGLDYNAPTNPVLVFAAGQLSASFTIDVLTDNLVEGEETIPLAIGGPTGGAVVGAVSTSLVKIADRQPMVQFLAPTYPVVETPGGTNARLTVVRSGDRSTAVSVVVTEVPGTATNGTDYTFAGPITLNFPPFSTSQSFTVPVHYTSDYEGSESVTFALGTPSGATVGPLGSATLVITDAQPVVHFAAAAYSVPEPSGSTPGKVTITVKRTGNLSVPSSVDFFTTNGSATAGADYFAASGTLSFASGQAAQSFSVDVLPDFDAEGNEDFTVTLANPLQASLGTPAVATVNIGDNDAGGAIEFTSSVFTVTESEGVAFITVKRTGGAAGNVTVKLQASNGTASAADYPPFSQTLTLGPNQPGTFAFFTVVRDFTAEPPETVNLTLSNPTGGAVLGPKSTAVLWVLD